MRWQWQLVRLVNSRKINLEQFSYLKVKSRIQDLSVDTEQQLEILCEAAFAVTDWMSHATREFKLCTVTPGQG